MRPKAWRCYQGTGGTGCYVDHSVGKSAYKHLLIWWWACELVILTFSIMILISKDPHLLLCFTQPRKKIKNGWGSNFGSTFGPSFGSQTETHRKFEVKKIGKDGWAGIFYLWEHRSAQPRLKFRNSCNSSKFSHKIAGLSPNMGMDGLFGQGWMGTCGQGCWVYWVWFPIKITKNCTCCWRKNQVSKNTRIILVKEHTRLSRLWNQYYDFKHRWWIHVFLVDVV